MSGKVVLPAAAAEPRLGKHPNPQQAEAKAARPAEASESPGEDLRLIIEETDAPDRYLYTVVDRNTGRIVSQLHRDEVLRLKELPNYSAGAVFRGKA